MRPRFEFFDVTKEMSAKQLLRLLKGAISVCPDAVVTIRQTQGTDFPPYIAIESPAHHDKTDAEGAFTNLLTR